MAKKAKFTKSGNPFMAAAAHELRRSSAAMPHTPKPRKGTRTSNARKAIREFS